MAITNEVDLTHIARTTEQWENTYDRNVIIPEGVLCIEFTPSGKTNIKIGDGHHIFSRLPYVNGSSEIIDCYTKQETDNRIVQILNNECVVRIKGILDDASKLPVHAACGDLWFVIRQNPEQGNKFEEYLYSSEHHWELIGGTPVDIDLSKYATKEYVDSKLIDIENKLHTHDNKSILDQITAAFTKEEKEKLKNLYNYDDTELRELIAKSLHTHSNKEVLDAITKYDIDKLRTLENYDDTLLKKKITALEALAHEHSNKSILDKTTASFTTDYERLMSLIRLYIGATGFDDGAAGLVPPAKAGEQNYILTGSGKWVPNTGGGTYELPIASDTEIGGVIIGDGLSITEDGILSTTSEAGIQYEAGRAIEITDKIIPGDLVLDIFQDGTNWANGAYTSSTGNGFIQGWSACVHSPVNNTDVMYKVLDNTNRYRIEKRSVDGTQLSCTVSYIDAAGYRFAASPVWEDDDITIHECPAGTAFIAIGIRWLDHVSSISVSDIGVVNLVWIGAGESVENVKVINAQIATTETPGVVTVGNGLTVTEEGVLSVSDDINNSYHAGLGINITEEPIPGDIELDILNNEYAGWENFTYLWTGGAEYEETNYVLHTTRDRIADENTGEWLTHFKLPDGVERIKVEAAAKDGTPLKFWIDNHDSETLYRWSLLGRWYDSGETTDYPDEYKPALLKYNYISIGLCFDTDNTRTISVDDIDYVRLYFIEADKDNPKGMGKYINSNIATDYQLGGVIIGKGINVDKEGVISVDAIPLEPATADKLGGVKIGEGLNITEDGTISATASTVYNAGKGISITKGSRKIPVEYQEIEYIESDGSAIFDTGYLANPSTVIDMDCIVYESSKSDWQFLYGSRSSTYDTTTIFGFVVRHYQKGYVPELWIPGEQLGTSSTFPYNERTILKQNMNELTWYPVSTGESVTITGTRNLPTSSTTFAVSGFKDGSVYTFGPKCRIYSLKISDVNGITRDYVPCYRISDGVVGLYDLINDTFRYSATSTAFISGPVVSDSGGSTDDELYINNTGLLDANLKEDAPGVIIVSKSDETKELDVFQYISGLEVYCVEDSI